MAAKTTSKVKQTRKAKPLPNPDQLSEEQIAHLEEVAKALPQFLEAQKFLLASPNAPTFAKDARDGAWRIVYKKLKLSGVFKSKRKPVSPEMEKWNKTKGSLLQAVLKAKREHGEATPQYKTAKAEFESHMKKNPNKK